MGIYPIQKWEFADGFILFVTVTTTIASIIILFPYLDFLLEHAITLFNKYTVFNVSSNYFSTFILAVVDIAISLFLNMFLFVRGFIISFILVSIWDISPWIAVPAAFIPDFIIILSVFSVQIQIAVLKNRGEYIETQKTFIDHGAEIRRQILKLKRNFDKHSDQFGALGFIVKYIDTTLDFIVKGNTKYPGHIRSDFVLSTTKNFISRKPNELTSLIELYVKTVELEKFVREHNSHTRFSDSIFV